MTPSTPSCEARHVYRDLTFGAAYDCARVGGDRKKPERDLQTRRAVLRALARRGDVEHVLDLPCGTGRLTQSLLDTSLRYTGIDAGRP